MVESDELRLAARLAHLDIASVREAVRDDRLRMKPESLLLLESQEAVLREVDRELGKAALTRRVRALAESTIGVVPSLLNGIARANRGVEIPTVEKCRVSVSRLADLLSHR